MKIILTTIAISLLYAIAVILFSLAKTSGETFESFLMIFSFILLPAFICVCVFNLVLKLFGWKGKPLSILAQVLLLVFIFNLVLFPIAIPDFNRHQNNAGYTHYSSFSEYFRGNMLEGILTATAFAILIPLLDKLFKNFIRLYKRQHPAN
ncbi:MAG: hypothetical protein ACTHMD_10660 [Flavisolibacter sp.]